MQHLFQIAIDVDDERIRQSIEESGEQKIIDALIDRAVRNYFEPSHTMYGRNPPLKDLTVLKGDVMDKLIQRFDSILKEREDEIVDRVVLEVSKKVYRTKACKDAISKTLNQ